MATQELTFKITATDAGLKSVMASARAEIQQTAQSQKAVSQSELSMRQQLAAAASLQRQRSAALIADWKKQEAAAKAVATATRPVGENLQVITNIMRQLGSSIGVLQGPLNGISGRITALGTLARTTSSDLDGMGASATSSGGALAAAAGPVGIAIIAIGALAAGTVLLTKALFDLAVQAADFRGKMFDLSQQTGVAVETLSTLEVLATTTGGSIESIAQSLVIFQGHLDEAQDSGSKAGKMFEKLGISTNNTEEAFRSALTQIAKMPVGFEQTNTAAELFGRRGGKQVLAIVKEMGGDLDATTEKLREMGLVISTEDARAADEFNDQLAILHFQIRALLGKEVIPAALEAVKEISRFLKENKTTIDTVGEGVGDLASIIGGVLMAKLHELEGQLIVINAILEVTGGLFRDAASAIGLITPPDFSAVTGGASGSILEAGAGASVGGGITRKKSAAGRRAAGGTGKSEGQRELEQQLAFFKQLTAEGNELADTLLGIDTTTREYAVSQSNLNGALREMALLTAKGIDDDTKQIRLNKELADFQKDQIAAVRLLIEGEQGHIAETVELIASLEKQGQLLDQTTKFWLMFRAAILSTDDSIKMIKETLESLPPVLAGAAAIPGLSDDEIGQAAGAAANAGMGVPPPIPPEVFDSWALLKTTALDALGSMAQGVGQLAQAWVLYGNAGPNAMRKMVASVLAGVAAQAAVQAVMELAYGIAALTPWGAAIYGPAPLHFKSAALFGSIALVAGLAGRAVAGDAFAQTTGGGGGGGGSQGFGTVKPPNPIDIDRRSGGGSQAPTVIIHMSGEAAAAFDYKVVRAVVGNHRLNGEIRQMTEDGKS